MSGPHPRTGKTKQLLRRSEGWQRSILTSRYARTYAGWYGRMALFAASLIGLLHLRRRLGNIAVFFFVAFGVAFRSWRAHRRHRLALSKFYPSGRQSLSSYIEAIPTLSPSEVKPESGYFHNKHGHKLFYTKQGTGEMRPVAASAAYAVSNSLVRHAIAQWRHNVFSVRTAHG